MHTRRTAGPDPPFAVKSELQKRRDNIVSPGTVTQIGTNIDRPRASVNLGSDEVTLALRALEALLILRTTAI